MLIVSINAIAQGMRTVDKERVVVQELINASFYNLYLHYVVPTQIHNAAGEPS
jgi:hypothetical protein